MEPSPDMVQAALTVDPAARIVDVTLMTGGSSAYVVALDLHSPSLGPRRVVFRQHASRSIKEHGPAIAAKEFNLLGCLHRANFDVPKPIAIHSDGNSAGPWLVMEWVEGHTAQSHPDTDSTLEPMAGFLSRLHSMPVDTLLTSQLTSELDRIEDPASALPGYLSGHELDQTISSVLSEGSKRRPNQDSVLHGDYWPGNVLFSSAELVAVIDWEDATIGDPLADLACARVEIFCAFGTQQADDFTEHYCNHLRASGNTVDTFDLPLWEMYVSATALQSMHLWGLPATEEADRRRTTDAFLRRAAALFLAN